MVFNMKSLKKSNRVSWAPGANLCQVRLFLSEDCPSKVALEGQHHLQVRTSWIPHSSGVGFDSRLTGYMNPLKETLSKIPQIKWKCPPKFALNYIWLVAAGEESEEIGGQKQREKRVPEAVYYRQSAIPSSPSMSLDVEDSHGDDSHIPIIPIIPVEEAAANLLSDVAVQPNTSISSQLLDPAHDSVTSANFNTPLNLPVSLNPPSNEKPILEMLPGLEGDVLVAAAAALTAIMKSNEQGSLIDTDLLIQFLSNPKLIEKLVNEHGEAANTRSELISGLKPVEPLVPLPNLEPTSAIEKSVNDHESHANTGNTPISGPETVNPEVPWPRSKSEVVNKKLTNELGAPANTGIIPISRSKPIAQSVCPTSSKPGVALIKNLLNEHGAPAHMGTSHIAGLMPVASLVPFPSSKPDVTMIKRMINEYGTPDNTGNELLSGSLKPSSPMVSLHSPKSDLVMLPRQNMHPRPSLVQPSLHVKPVSPHIHASHFSAMVAPAPPVKDINYYKNLIKQHGEMQEAQDRYLSHIGKPYNCLHGPDVVQNLKPSELKPKHQKPCMYFNSSKGCRNGSNCPYQHGISNGVRPSGVLESPSAKRMKLSGEIMGRT